MAAIIWCMPQFSLCYGALSENLVGESIGQSTADKLIISAVLLAATGTVVILNSRRGLTAKIFDWFLKALVGMIVVCFVGVVVRLAYLGKLDFSEILVGYIPNLRLWNEPAGDVAALIAQLPADLQEYWKAKMNVEQHAVMIGAAATAVGINMTCLLPYSMLHRGWDKPFRGLARFDLLTGMAIPYILVTSCIVIASAFTFHADADPDILSTSPETMAESPVYDGFKPVLLERVKFEVGEEAFDAMSEEEQLRKAAALPEDEKKIASSLVRRTESNLAAALEPLLGKEASRLVFGLGIFGMGFSTIIILMLINGFVFTEIFGLEQGGPVHVIGCAVAGISGALWPLVWDGPAKIWLAILASSFGMMLLPIAYITFFAMMNSRSILGDEKPTGLRMLSWNVLMILSVLGAIAAAGTAVWDKVAHGSGYTGNVVLGIAIVYGALVVLGFFFRKPASNSETAAR